MIVFVNGEFFSEDRARVSVFDRAFLYGDGIFEAIRVCNSRLFRFESHFSRLQRGAEFLKIRVPYSSKETLEFIQQLIAQNGVAHGILRITLSRGIGPRGYSPKGSDHPTLVMHISPLPADGFSELLRWRLITSSLRVVADDPIAQHKTCSKLHQVLARGEADAAGAEEALLLNSQGEVAEGTSSNIFWIEGQSVCTTPLTAGILPGVTRSVVRELCERLNIFCEEKTMAPAGLRKADAIFLTLTSLGIVEIASWDEISFPSHELIAQLHRGYSETLINETAFAGPPSLHVDFGDGCRPRP